MKENEDWCKPKRFSVKLGTMLVLCLVILAACASVPPSQAGIKTAISQYQQTLLDSIVEHSGTDSRPAVAVLDIASDDARLGVFATEEIILQLVKTRQFRVVDRDSVETLLKEQNFQYSGMVSDETMVSIGKFIGASVIITGQILPRGRRVDLSLRILDVETAEIINLISIPIG